MTKLTKDQFLSIVLQKQQKKKRKKKAEYIADDYMFEAMKKNKKSKVNRR